MNLSMKLIDLTHLITETIPVYPGTAQPEIKTIATHEQQGFLEHELKFSSHIGTHIDAPAHMLKDGLTLDQMDISAFHGSAMQINCTHKNTKNKNINIDDLAGYESTICEVDFILINTGWYRYWGSENYFVNYPTLSPEAAKWLTDFNLKGIGVDVMSIDPPETKDFNVHNILLENGIMIIENLTNLHSLPHKDIIFNCMPLKYKSSDGSPVRAIAFSATGNKAYYK